MAFSTSSRHYKGMYVWTQRYIQWRNVRPIRWIWVVAIHDLVAMLFQLILQFFFAIVRVVSVADNWLDEEEGTNVHDDLAMVDFPGREHFG